MKSNGVPSSTGKLPSATVGLPYGIVNDGIGRPFDNGKAIVSFTANPSVGKYPPTGFNVTLSGNSQVVPSSPANFEGLATGTALTTFNTRAVNDFGQSTQINYTQPAVTITTVPNVVGPASLTVVSPSVVNANFVQLTTSPNNGGTSVIGYSGLTSTGITSTVTFPTSSLQFPLQTPGIPVTVQIRAQNINGYGEYGTASNTVIPGAAVFYAHQLSNTIYVSAFPFESFFTTRYSPPAFTSMATAITLNSNASVVAVATTTSPYIYTYQWSTSGFGTKFADPATTILVGTPTSAGPYGLDFNPSGDTLAVSWRQTVSTNNTHYLSAYQWNNGFGTKYATLTYGTSFSTSFPRVKFSPDGNTIVTSNLTSPFIHAYPWSSSGFGTKYANPSNGATSNISEVTWNNTGSVVAAGSGAFPWSAGFGTRYVSAAGSTISSFWTSSFNPQGTAILRGGVTSQTSSGRSVEAYAWNNATGYGTKYTSPTGFAQVLTSSFNARGNFVTLGKLNAVHVNMYPFSDATGFGTLVSNPVTVPSAQVNDTYFI